MPTPRWRRQSGEMERDTEVRSSWCGPGMRLFVSFWLFGTLIAMQFSAVITAANDLVADRAPTGLILFTYSLPSVLIRTLVPFISFPDLTTYLPSSFHRGMSSLINRLSRQTDTEEVDKFYISIPNPSSAATGSTNDVTTRPQVKRSNALTKQVNYPLRLSICVFSSFCGLQLLAWTEVVSVRLVGIAMASLSSNLGDMSFLQLCSHYPASIGSATALGGYTTGTGSAALVGAFLYTFFTSTLGVSPSATISMIGVLPVALLFTYAFLLPRPADAGQVEGVARGEDLKEEVGISRLSVKAKLRIVRPMFWRYMAPLAAVMFVENSIVQGIVPTLLFYLPFLPSTTALPNLLNSAFKATRDFYPVYVTTYQFSVFLGRSSISFFQLPASPGYIWWLVLTELLLLSLQVGESFSMARMNDGAGVLYGPLVVLCLMVIMGLCGGLAFSNTYWKVNNRRLPVGVWDALERARSEGPGGGGYARVSTMEGIEEVNPHDSQLGVERDGEEMEAEKEMAMREFLLSTIAPPDTIAILLASLVGMKVQPVLCAGQVGRGRLLCQKTRE